MISVYKKLHLDADINYVRDVVIKNARIKDVMSNLTDNSKLKLFLHNFPLDKCDIMDLKVKKYRKGEFSCINNWHYDFVESYDDPKPHETNYLWFNCINTQFKTIDTEPFTIYKYGRDLHNGNYAENDCVRLFVRMSKVASYNNFKLKINDLKLIESNIG
jgi:hypothetical protein